MSDEPTTTGSKLVNSVILTLIARFAMVVAAAALPFGLWILQRGIGSVDEISKKIDVVHDQAMETNGSMKLIKQSQESQSQLLADHEIRVRALESFNRATRP